MPPFILGFAWLHVILIPLRGFMAARQVSVEYFRFVGKEHQELALFIVNVVFHLVPEVVLLISGVVLSAHILKGSRRLNAAMFAVGAFVSDCFWLVFYQADAATQVHGAPSLLWQELRNSIHAPWWAVPPLLSPIIGLAIGVWLATKGKHAAVRTGA